MIEWTASVQPLVIAALLGWAGVVKLRGRPTGEAQASGLARLVGEHRAPAVLRLVGGVELVIAAALLLPPAAAAEAAAAAALAAGFLGYLGYLRRVAPEAGCGCLSSRPRRVSWRSFGRAGFLLATALFALAAGGLWWPGPVAERPLPAGLLLLVELGAVVALSPELDRYWLVPLRQLKVRLTHPLADRSPEVPLEFTVEQLELSEAYRRIGAAITSDVQDHWDDGEWRIVSYLARHQGGAATAVFAVPLHRYEPEAVRVVLVDERQGEPMVSRV